MSSGVRRVMRGSFVGTGANIDIKGEVAGFSPGRVALWNVTGNCQAVWTESMPAGAMVKLVDSGSGTTDQAYVTGGNGVTPLTDGFRLGADAELHVAGEVVHWEVTE